MKSLVSIVIPIAPYHAAQSVYAVMSARSQTVPCAVVTVEDAESRGAGFARNRGLERVTTDFVVFLDADDTIEPSFVEETLRAYQPGHYVYTDWLDDKLNFSANPWKQGDWHPVTTLLPTDAVRAIGAFREDTPGGEDSEMYFELVHRGVCALRVPKPLFHYHKGGLRGRSFVGSPAHDAFIERVMKRYGANMGCCGDDGTVVFAPESEELQPDHVWAMATWGGNRDQRGFSTGKMYRRAGNGKILQVHKDDVAIAPHMWKEVPKQTFPTAIQTPPKPTYAQMFPKPTTAQVGQAAPTVAAPVDGLSGIAAALFPDREKTYTAEEIEAVRPSTVAPNINKLLALARGAKNAGQSEAQVEPPAPENPKPTIRHAKNGK